MLLLQAGSMGRHWSKSSSTAFTRALEQTPEDGLTPEAACLLTSSSRLISSEKLCGWGEFLVYSPAGIR